MAAAPTPRPLQQQLRLLQLLSAGQVLHHLQGPPLLQLRVSGLQVVLTGTSPGQLLQDARPSCQS